VNERAMVLTSEGRIFKMDPSKKFKVMMSFTLGDVLSLSISPEGSNQVNKPLRYKKCQRTSFLLLSIASCVSPALPHQ